MSTKHELLGKEIMPKACICPCIKEYCYTNPYLKDTFLFVGTKFSGVSDLPYFAKHH